MWLDLETTGLNHETAGIVEIAGLFQYPGQERSSKRFEDLVDPRKRLDGTERMVEIQSKALEVNGISLDQLDGFGSLDKSLMELDSHVDRWCVIAGWNVSGFDIPFLKEAYKRAGIKWRFHHHCLDMMVVANWLKFCGLLHTKSLSLQNMAQYLGIDTAKFGDAHRAMPDVWTTIAIAKRFRDDYLGNMKISF